MSIAPFSSLKGSWLEDSLREYPLEKYVNKVVIDRNYQPLGPQVLKIGFSSIVGVNWAWVIFRLERALEKSINH